MATPKTDEPPTAVAEEISTARCLALYRSGLLVGYVSREWNYGTYAETPR